MMSSRPFDGDGTTTMARASHLRVGPRKQQRRVSHFIERRAHLLLSRRGGISPVRGRRESRDMTGWPTGRVSELEGRCPGTLESMRAVIAEHGLARACVVNFQHRFAVIAGWSAILNVYQPFE